MRRRGRMSGGGAILAVLALWAALAPVRAEAQQGTARLSGVVFDSTEMRTLAGARVAVLGTSLAGLTDERGRFRLEGVPAGSYWVSFYHERLQELGVSPPSREVAFSENASVELELAVPSERTLLLGWCAAEQPGPGYAALAGVVFDSLTGVPLPRAIVTAATVLPRPGDPPPLETRTDEKGYYRFCTVPAGRELRLEPRFGRDSGPPTGLVLASGGGEIVNLAMQLSVEGTLAGRVVDYASGTPLQGATVTVLGTGVQRISARDGTFVLDGLPPGRHLVHTEHLGYEPRSDSVTVFSQETVSVEVRLNTGAIEIPGLVVTARSRFGHTRLAADKRADILTRADIEPILPRVKGMADLLRAVRVPGLRVSEVSVAQRSGIVVPGICVEVGRRTGRAPGGCVQAAVFINDVLVPLPDQVLMLLDPNTVQRIEVLNPLDAQFQFGDAGANGAVLIYTR